MKTTGEVSGPVVLPLLTPLTCTLSDFMLCFSFVWEPIVLNWSFNNYPICEGQLARICFPVPPSLNTRWTREMPRNCVGYPHLRRICLFVVWWYHLRVFGDSNESAWVHKYARNSLGYILSSLDTCTSRNKDLPWFIFDSSKGFACPVLDAFRKNNVT